MICKEDVVSWFKELESYKRIDTMCTLLSMCLPFELRFLGTCLEELGRRDSQELRGIELRINNPLESAADIASCQSGEPTDMKIRRKMALYLALIRACSRSCVNELFKTLDGWGEKDFTKINDPDTLQELLLVYTMATNHPVFSFEQRMKCGEIFTKIEQSKTPQSYHHQEMSQQQQGTQQQQSIHLQQAGHQQQVQAPVQIIPQGNIPMGFPQGPISQLIPTDVNLQHQIAVDGIHHILPSSMAIPSEFVGHPNALTWTLRSNIQTYPPSSLEPISFILQQQHPPQSSSPMLSQPSSPSHSRTTSPNRSSSNIIQQQSQPIRNPPQRGVSLRNSRRPSVETSPPTTQQQQQQLIGLVPNEMIIQQNLKNLEDVVLNVDGTMTQLQTLCRNGYRPGHHTIPRQSKSTGHLQHHGQQHHNQPLQTISPNILSGPSSLQPGSGFGVNANLAYTLQNMSLVDIHNPIENNTISNRLKSGGGSDSGSSIGSGGDVSPPDTPTIITNNSSNSSSNIRLNDQSKMNVTRLNGRADKILSGLGSNNGSGGSGSGTTTVIYASTTNNPQQHQFIGNEIILTTGPNLMPSPVTNNNNNSLNSTGGISSSSNNNMATSTVLMTSPSSLTGGVSNVITTNPVILQQQQQQFSATYPYHPQHLSATNRPPLLSHNPALGPPGTFRHPGFQIQHNGEILYPYATQVAATPSGITFLPPSAAPPPQVVRTSPSTSVPTTVSLPIQQPTQQQPPPPQMQQTHQPPPNTLLAVSPYTTLTVANKAISCFNCGSQSHTGRDCQEVSMEDVTRCSIYKLDYSSTSSPNNSNNSGTNNLIAGSSSSSINSGGGGGGSGVILTSNMTSTEITTETSSPTSSSSSLSISNNNK